MEERESLDVDILFIGGGVACLSGAIHLSNLIEQKRMASSQSQDPLLDESETGQISIAVLEKGDYAGAHAISGAVMEVSALAELIPDYRQMQAPIEAEVRKEDVYFLTRNGKFRFPLTPPPMNNHGNCVVSLSRLTEWLVQIAEERGIDFFSGFAATEVLYDGQKVIGVRTGDKGVDPDGERKPNFEPGIDLKAKVTVFGEGSRGSLTKELVKKFQLDDGRNPDSYVIGVKEVWEVAPGTIEPGAVIHTMGYPHNSRTYGGGFIYGMRDSRISIGLMTGLDYQDPGMDPHREFQRFKTHPFIASLLKDGKILQYGANTTPVGGYFSIPRLYFDGGLLVGDSASLFISQKIKGVHAAMKSGMLAAETIFQALCANDFSAGRLKSYETAVVESDMGKALYKSRNFHQLFQKGLYRAIFWGGLQYLLGGRIIKPRLFTEPDHAAMKTIKAWGGASLSGNADKKQMPYDGQLTFDKESDVYYSGTSHEEHQPSHIRIIDPAICYEQCIEQYQAPCQRFCPAKVYEMLTDAQTGEPKLRVNFSNCLHCKTCDVKDPYQNITWTPPEGGDGPKYTIL